MVKKAMRDAIAELNDQAIVFDNPSFDRAIIGIDTTGRVIYSLPLMVQEMVCEEGISRDDAYEFIQYNTIRMLPYIEENVRPIILDIIEV